MKAINLQDAFLNQARKENISVTIYLVNGFQLRGNVTGFDNFTVILDSNGKQQLVYKHAISTITPMHPLSMNYTTEKKDSDTHI
ncbi:RNA chaperone Hfq [Pectinatus haikarae]|uniref:RNA-binding protein Hfq n=1 Tax=Pectinatus haikarae TaxID=349096 RepID=A0ABT9YAA2_9FIRM|nr:RNA chaperone Hfq [Pectinatus haikarae]MDQ0204466.1 host factor-I protein [Pectinatus haikarae]